MLALNRTVALFLTSSAPAIAIGSTLLILEWDPLSVPLTFTTIGGTVTRANQGMAFALQSIQKRLPRIIGPAVAGFVLPAGARYYDNADVGYVMGIRCRHRFVPRAWGSTGAFAASLSAGRRSWGPSSGSGSGRLPFCMWRSPLDVWERRCSTCWHASAARARRPPARTRHLVIDT